MIRLSNISKSYGTQLLFNEVSFNINAKEKIGILGRNGYGKTTLLRLLTGDETSDSGEIIFPKDYKIGYLPQHTSFQKGSVILEASYDSGGRKVENWKACKILAGLGFDEEMLQMPPDLLSEGYKLRLKLAKMILSDPDIMLLDEPNNYLDVVAIRWLEKFLNSWDRELLLITHDRSFMDSVVTHTMLIHRHKIKKLEGNTKKIYDQVALEEEIYERTRKNEEKRNRKTEEFIRKFRAKARLAGAVQSRIKTIEKKQPLEKLSKLEQIDFSFRESPSTATVIGSVNDISFSYETDNHVIKGISFDIERNDRILLIGKNGRGKSTLLKLLSGYLKPDSGNIKYHVNTEIAYYSQTDIVCLNDDLSILEEISSLSSATQHDVRNVCGSLLFKGDEVEKKISYLSGGERCRVLLAKVLLSPSNLLLLDEPGNHLDMESCAALLEAVNNFSGAVIMVSHNEMFINELANKLIVFDKTIDFYHGDYDYFLSKKGWSEEKDENEQNCTDDNRQTRKRLEAELRNERYKILHPLEESIKNKEHEIYVIEKEKEKSNTALVRASEKGEADNIAVYSKKLSEQVQKIDGLLTELELLYDEHSKLSREYENRFRDL